MDIRRSWVAVGAAAVLGVGATTTAAIALDDRAPLSTGGASADRAPGVEREPAGTGAVDASPESADSPNASAVDSADSASDRDDDRDSTADSTADSTPDDRLDDTADSTADSPR